jgi:hypothetical protein
VANPNFIAFNLPLRTVEKPCPNNATFHFLGGRFEAMR